MGAITSMSTSMSMKRKALVVAGLSAVMTFAAAGEDVYKAAGEIPIGGEGGWDILTIDSGARRLYLSHATKVVVVDLAKNAVAGEVADTPGVHEFFPVVQVGRGFTSNGKENKSSVVDLKTLRTTGKIDTGANPDAMAFDSKRGELYIFNHTGNSATVIDPKTPRVIATVSLGGGPEFGAADGEAGRVYVNLEDKNEVAVIDTAKHEIIARWPIAPGEEASGLALDAAHHRLFAVCHNKMMVMLDSTNGKVLANAPIGDGPDGCAFDDATQLVFASCGEGVVTIAKADGPDHLAVVQTLKTERGARTIALDPTTHRIYLPTAQFEPAPSPSPGQSPSRPKIVANTQKLLIYGPAN
jgi:YVTN family beta-propeller protein